MLIPLLYRTRRRLLSPDLRQCLVLLTHFFTQIVNDFTNSLLVPSNELRGSLRRGRQFGSKFVYFFAAFHLNNLAKGPLRSNAKEGILVASSGVVV